MLSEMELEVLTTNLIDKEHKEMLEFKRMGGGDCGGGKAEQTEVMGSVAKCCGADCVSCKNVRKD